MRKVPGSEFRVSGSELSPVRTYFSFLAIGGFLVQPTQACRNGSLRGTRNSEPGSRNRASV
jgi:hypothetical protein